MDKYKYTYIYCNRCEEFYLNWSTDFGNMDKACPKCFTKDIIEYRSDSFAGMAQVEREYKLRKLNGINRT